MHILMREPRIEEMPVVRNIWNIVFASADVDDFFSFYYNRELCVSAIYDGTAVAAGHLLPAGELGLGGRRVPCAMIYAVATLPEFRSLGIGSAIVNELISIGRSAGFPAIVLCPSSDSLFDFYSAHTEFRDFFYICERKVSYSHANPINAPISAVSPSEYALLRRGLLAGNSFLDQDYRALEYQSLLCRRFGGGLFRIDGPDGVSCAAIETHNGSLAIVKELLTPNGVDNALSAIAAMFPSEEYLVRCPVSLSGSHPNTRRFGMLAIESSLDDAGHKNAAPPWYGLAFD